MKWLRVVFLTLTALAGAHNLFACNPIVVKVQPTGGYFCPNQQTRLFFIVDAGGEAVTYRWYKDGKLIAGQNTDTLEFAGTEEEDGSYYARASTACETVQSNTVSAGLKIVLFPKNRINLLNTAFTENINVQETSWGTCTWTATADVPWITINSATGSGNGTVNYSVAANPGGVPRAGTITIGGRTFHVTQGVVPDDFNADGKSDLVWRNYATNESSVWLMNGTQFIQKCLLPSKTLSYSIEATGDFNQDAKPDILWRNVVTGAVRLTIMDGVFSVRDVVLPTISPLSRHIEGTGDFNNDGNIDIVIRDYASGENMVWVMNREKLTWLEMLTAEPDLNKAIEAVADVDANFTPDLVFRNKSTGTTEVWKMSGLTRSSILALQWADPVWNLETAHDINGDRTADLIWRNYQTGQHPVWTMTQWGQLGYADMPWEFDLDQHLSGRGPSGR